MAIWKSPMASAPATRTTITWYTAPMALATAPDAASATAPATRGRLLLFAIQQSTVPLLMAMRAQDAVDYGGRAAGRGGGAGVTLCVAPGRIASIVHSQGGGPAGRRPDLTCRHGPVRSSLAIAPVAVSRGILPGLPLVRVLVEDLLIWILILLVLVLVLVRQVAAGGPIIGVFSPLVSIAVLGRRCHLLCLEALR